jgi:hypothetical protein
MAPPRLAKTPLRLAETNASHDDDVVEKTLKECMKDRMATREGGANRSR